MGEGSGLATSATLALIASLSASPAFANPDGAQVVAGSATVAGQGTPTVTVKQTSQKTILNWDSFSIKAGELTQFLQPGAQAIALNRVIGADPSLIYGTLTANGRLILINPNGLAVGPSGVVQANSFIASTAGVSDENFLSNKLTFDIAGNPNARIVNEGTVTAAESGLAAFVAPSVKNTGLISAKLGTVTLGAATKFTLDFYGDDLVSFPVDADVAAAPEGAKALIEAGGTIEGATVILSAHAARGVINDFIVADGAIIARTANVVDGKIRLGSADPRLDRLLTAAPEFDVTEVVSEAAMNSAGGAIKIDGGANGRVMLSGTLDASGERGGKVDVKGEQAHITGSVLAKGSHGRGGKISVSGTRFVSFGGLLSADGTSGGIVTAISAAGDFSLGGVATARGFAGQGGAIDIAAAGESWEFGGSLLDVSGATHGGTIRNIIGEKLVSSASYLARGEGGKGGAIDATAADMFLLSSTFDASGHTNGGQVRLGGEFQGGKSLTVDELHNAQTLSANDGVNIDISSRGPTGDGGTAIVWSDKKTAFFGYADARPGLVSGTGGLIEASSLEQLIWRGAVETARNGERGGTLLLDPKNIIVDVVSPGPLGALLDPLDRLGYGGNSISLDGTRLAVGVFQDDGAGNSCTDCGAVYLFTFTDLNFSGGALAGRLGHGYTGGKNVDLTGFLDPDVGGPDVGFDGSHFGIAVSLDGTRLAVGAHSDLGASNACSGCGGVFLFTFSDASFAGGTLAARLGHGYAGGKNIDLSSILAPNDNFGTGVSLDGNRLAVGAQADDGATNGCSDCGGVYLFTFTDSMFTGGALAGRVGLGYSGGNNIDLTGIQATSNIGFGTSVSLRA